MPVATPGILIATLANDSSYHHVTRQRVVRHGTHAHAVHHRTFHLDIVDIDGLTHIVQRIAAVFKRPYLQHGISCVCYLVVVWSGTELKGKYVPVVGVTQPEQTASAVTAITFLYEFHQNIMCNTHLHSESHAAQTLKVDIAQGEGSIAVLLVPSAGISLQCHLQAFITIFFYDSRVGTIPKTAIAT